MIQGFIGRPGAGKTYSMVSLAYRLHGRVPIYSNMSLSWAQQVETVDELVGLTNGLVLLDEAGLWFNSRYWSRVSIEQMSWFAQSRKRGVHLWFTSQSEAAVDASIRRLVATYVYCMRYGPLIVQRWVDPNDLRARGLTRFMWLSERVFRLYDTYEIVGDGSGQGRGRGEGAVQGLRGVYVRECVLGGVVRYREAGPGDLIDWRSVCLVRRDGSGFRELSREDLEALGVARRDPLAGGAPGSREPSAGRLDYGDFSRVFGRGPERRF